MLRLGTGLVLRLVGLAQCRLWVCSVWFSVTKFCSVWPIPPEFGSVRSEPPPPPTVGAPNFSGLYLFWAKDIIMGPVARFSNSTPSPEWNLGENYKNHWEKLNKSQFLTWPENFQTVVRLFYSLWHLINLGKALMLYLKNFKTAVRRRSKLGKNLARPLFRTLSVIY